MRLRQLMAAVLHLHYVVPFGQAPPALPPMLSAKLEVDSPVYGRSRLGPLQIFVPVAKAEQILGVIVSDEFWNCLLWWH